MKHISKLRSKLNLFFLVIFFSVRSLIGMTLQEYDVYISSLMIQASTAILDDKARGIRNSSVSGKNSLHELYTYYDKKDRTKVVVALLPMNLSRPRYHRFYYITDSKKDVISVKSPITEYIYDSNDNLIKMIINCEICKTKISLTDKIYITQNRSHYYDHLAMCHYQEYIKKNLQNIMILAQDNCAKCAKAFHSYENLSEEQIKRLTTHAARHINFSPEDDLCAYIYYETPESMKEAYYKN